jgi:hypothetical protein
MTDNGIVWEDPPEGHAGRWVRRLEPLMERPGAWAKVIEQPGRHLGNVATQLRARKFRVPPGSWEFKSRRTGPETTALYARYLGPEDGT